MRTETTLRRVLISVLLLLLAIISCLLIADKASSVEVQSDVLASLDEKVDTVLKLTASSTVVSVGISAIPDDTATPIAEKLTDLSTYFLLILCVLYTEKYLLTVIGAAVFRFIIPAACLIGIYGQFRSAERARPLALRIGILGLALYFIIPGCIRISDKIYETYEHSVNNTISEAEELTDETAGLADAGEDSTLIGSILQSISQTVTGLTDKAARLMNRFLESIAVLIVTSCIMPVLAVVFFLWLIKTFIGADPPTKKLPAGEPRGDRHDGDHFGGHHGGHHDGHFDDL